MLGRIQPAHFPSVFGDRGDEHLDAGIVRRQFAALAARIGEAASGPEQVAAGFLAIAVANMANAVKKISVQRGYDVTQYVLATFGGAGGQHACAVADALGITKVLIHPLAGVLSAYGMGLADVTAMREKAVEAPLTDQLLPELDRVATSLHTDALAELTQQGIDPGRVRAARRAHLRYDGTDTALPVPLGGVAEMVTSFEQAYRQHFSFLMRGKTILVEAVSVELAAASAVQAGKAGHAGQPPGGTPRDQRAGPAGPGQPATGAAVAMYTAGAWANVPLVRRRDLRPGQWLDGPALIVEDFATTVAEPGWKAELTGLGDLLLSRVAAPERQLAGTAADPVMLEIFNNLFMSVAEQMGVRLRSTAHSVNIKERLDFSCAIFDSGGGLIANAPHIPVHLGSMGESIGMVVRRNAGRMRAGDVYVLNDPYHGGTHLPDVTVVTPVFDGAGREILFYVASRGHHAEIGGITPGSMPAFSTRVEEEGVLIDNWLLVRGAVMREAETLDMLRSAPYPSRNPDVNLADLRAQIAANEKGVQELGRMVEHFGLDVVRAYMGHVQDNAEEAVRRVLAALQRRRIRLPARQRSGHPGRGPGGPGGPNRGGRLHRYLTAAGRQFQRAVVGSHGGRAVRVPHPGRRRHPAQFRLPQAGARDHPAGMHAGPGVSRGRGRRQRGDLAGHHGGTVRGAGRHGGGFGHDEQRHHRQRALPVLRDGRQRIGRGGGFRRHRRSADSYDQFPAHRPRSAGMALSGPARAVRDPARHGRGRALAGRRRRPPRGPLP